MLRHDSLSGFLQKQVLQSSCLHNRNHSLAHTDVSMSIACVAGVRTEGEGRREVRARSAIVGVGGRERIGGGDACLGPIVFFSFFYVQIPGVEIVIGQMDKRAK